MYYRMVLDLPTDFAVETAQTFSRHNSDFAPLSDSFTNTYRCPVTGVVMLQPSLQSDDWRTGLVNRHDWRLSDANWQSVQRSLDQAIMLTTALPTASRTSSPGSLIEIDVDAAIIAIASSYLYDELRWAAETNFIIQADESFAIHYNSINDGFTRKKNWLAVQWDNIGLHFSPQGRCTVYQYDRQNMAATPVMVDSFELFSPTEVHGKDGYFWFLPIPTLGLVVQHSTTPQQSFVQSSSSQKATSRGRLIPWPSYDVGNETGRMFEASPVRLAINPYQDYVLNMNRVTFAGTGSYLDAPFSLNQESTQTPTAYPIPLATWKQNIVGGLFNGKGNFAFTPGVDNSARMMSYLQTDDTRYTPFLFGYEATWPCLFATRNTTPYTLYSRAFLGDGGNRILSLSYTEDECGTVEGEAELFLSDTDLMAIAERGDATFRLDYTLSDDPYTSLTEADWVTVTGGLAKKWKNQYTSDGGGFYLKTTCSLHDMRELLHEGNAIRTGALDGKTIAEGINRILTSRGFAAITSFPTSAVNKVIPTPTDGKGWRFEGREGDNMSDYLDILLLFLRTQTTEYRARFDWPTYGWVIEKKPRDTVNFWTFSPKRSDTSVSGKVTHYRHAMFEPEPPEGNVVLVEGMLARSNTFIRIAGEVDNARVTVGPYVNFDSTSNPASQDYLGRRVPVTYELYPMSDADEMQLWLLRIAKIVTVHHGLCHDLYQEVAQMEVMPATRVKVQKKSGTNLIDGWVKQRTIHHQDRQVSATYQIDTVWEGKIARS